MRLLIPLKTITPFFSYFAQKLINEQITATIVATNEAARDGEKLFPEFEWVVQGTSVAGYPELIIGEIISSLDSNWWLRLDSDEWMSPETIRLISVATRSLDKSVIYGFERRWVGANPVDGKVSYRDYGRMFWSKPSVHATSVPLHDQNYRLFHSDYVYPSRTLHGVGVVGGTYGSLEQFGPIYHLDWLIQPKQKAKVQSSQLSKFSIKNYESFDDVYACKDSADASEWKHDKNLDYVADFLTTMQKKEK